MRLTVREVVDVLGTAGRRRWWRSTAMAAATVGEEEDMGVIGVAPEVNPLVEMMKQTTENLMEMAM